MSNSTKISIRFFNDREVRAVWDESGNKWWFSVIDIIASLGDSNDPRNYWEVLKNRLIKTKNELVTKCNQFKLMAGDGKRRLTDCLPQEEIGELIKTIPSKIVIFHLLWPVF